MFSSHNKFKISCCIKACKQAVTWKNPTIPAGFLAHFPLFQLICEFAILNIFLFFYSEVNGKYEITTQKQKMFFIPHQDSNHCPLELKASVLPMSLTDVF